MSNASNEIENQIHSLTLSDDSLDDDLDDDSLANHETVSREKYSFTVDNGLITRVSELEHGVLQIKSIKADEQYVLDGSDVLKYESEDFGQEITRYTDADGDGLFIKVSEQWSLSTDAGTSPMPRIEDSLKYFGSSGDDYVGLISDDASTGGAGADQFVVRQLGHMQIADFRHSDNDKIVFDTGLGLQSFEHLLGFVTAVNFDGQDIEVEFGDQVSLTLIGCNPEDFTGAEFVVLS